MGKITEQLLRKRAEHNDGVLSTMEEVSLHQLEIEKIENLEFYCRHLKILYLQNNIIEKLENLEKLKELEYLNLAVNSIQKIEGLQGCESLNKLDLTMNFIDIEALKESVDNLTLVPSLRELYLIGNGCENFKYCKEYVIARLPHLVLYNGNEIKKSERIKAIQMLSTIEHELDKASKEHIVFKQNDPNQNDPNRYSVEYRRKLYKDIENDRIRREQEKEESNKKSKSWWEDDAPKEPPSVYKDNGEIRLCNQGKYDIKLDEDIFKTAMTTFSLKLPKYLDTSKIKVDLHPQYVRVDVNGKITQWRFDYDIVCEKATIERSTTTGVLEIKAPIVGYTPKVQEKKQQPKGYWSKEDDKKKKNNNNNNSNSTTCSKQPGSNLKSLKAGIDFNSSGGISNANQIKEVEHLQRKEVDLDALGKECGVDLDEIPDLD